MALLRCHASSSEGMQSEVSGSSTHRPALLLAGCYPGFLPCWRRQKLPALSPLLSTGANPFPKAWLSASHLHPHPPSLTPWCGTEWGLGSSPVCCSSSSIIGLFLSLQPHPAPALFLSRIIHPLDIHEGSASTRFARHSQIHHTLPNLVLLMSFLHLERHFLPPLRFSLYWNNSSFKAQIQAHFPTGATSSQPNQKGFPSL